MTVMRPRVVVSEGLEKVCADWLQERAEVIYCSYEDQDQLKKWLADAQGLIVRTYTQVDKELLNHGPCLRVVGRAGVGLDNIDLEACKQRGIRVVYTPDANTQAVVEYVLALMLDALRPRADIDEHTGAQGFHRLRKELVGTELRQLTLGVLGFGRIGKRLGCVANAIGMRLLVNDLISEPELRRSVAYPFEYVDKEQLYRQSDILSIHVDGRASNRHLVGRPALKLLKPNCLLINTSRGMVVDGQALAQWADAVIKTGGRAVLDVHDPEPPPEVPPASVPRKPRKLRRRKFRGKSSRNFPGELRESCEGEVRGIQWFRRCRG